MPTTVQRLMVTTGEGTSRRLKGQAYFGDISFQLLILQFKTDPSALYTVCPEDTDNQHIFDGAVSITNHEGLAECSGLAIGDEDAVVDGVTYKALTALLLVFSSYETNDMPLRKAVSLQRAEATIDLFVGNRKALGLTDISMAQAFVQGGMRYLEELVPEGGATAVKATALINKLHTVTLLTLGVEGLNPHSER